MKNKLFDKPTDILVSECGDWLMDGNVAYHRDILPDEVVKAMGDETLLRAVLKLNGKTHVRIENGPDFSMVLSRYKTDQQKGYFKTPLRYTTLNGEDTTVFMSMDNDLVLLPTFCTQNISEVFGEPGGNTCFLARGDRMLICGFNTEYFDFTISRKEDPFD